MINKNNNNNNNFSHDDDADAVRGRLRLSRMFFVYYCDFIVQLHAVLCRKLTSPNRKCSFSCTWGTSCLVLRK